MNSLRFAFVGAVLTLSVATSNAGELVPYQAPGWKYLQVPWADPATATFYSASFDDSGWSEARGAFGEFAELSAPGTCSAAYTLHTQWDINTDLLLRRYVPSSSSSPLTIHLSIDNDATVYFNGVEVLATVHEYCPFPDDFSVVVPTSLLSPSGSNLLAIRAHDRGGFSFIDLRVEGEYPPVGVEAATWGRVKALFR